MGTCRRCGEVKAGKVVLVKPATFPPAFLCYDCEHELAEQASRKGSSTS